MKIPPQFNTRLSNIPTYGILLLNTVDSFYGPEWRAVQSLYIQLMYAFSKVTFFSTNISKKELKVCEEYF